MKKTKQNKNKIRSRKGVSKKKKEKQRAHLLENVSPTQWELGEKISLTDPLKKQRQRQRQRQHEAARESRGESEHVWESDSKREHVSCGELASRLHRLHKQETHHGEQLSCAQLHLPNWERRHTHTHTYVLTHWHTHAPLHSGRRLAHGLLHSAQRIFFTSYVVVLSNVSCGAQRKRIFLNWLFRFLTSFVVYSLYISLYCFPSFQVLLYVI